MKKYIIEVPEGIRYMSDWEEFDEIFPKFPHIMDKQIPGCGFTEYCIRNNEDTVICSPRNMLILNKWEQHPADIFRVHNDLYDLDPGVDKDICDDRVSKAESDIHYDFMAKLEKERAKADVGFTDKLARDLQDYIRERDRYKKPYKILVTYDSFRILKDVLQRLGILGRFRIVVDEFQSIFTDSRFKSNTELEFVGQLQDLEKVCYLSATPMMDKYLEMIPEFSELPFYELDWEKKEPMRIKKPDLKVRVVKSIYEPAKTIIEEYKAGDYKSKTVVDQETGELKIVYSKEAMIFVNSVNNIIQIIKKTELQPEECNILCANTPINQEKIDRGIGKEYRIGRVPLEGQPRKMFTFCTRTVYLGADFYSDNARTFVFSDSGIDCLAVDISLDLPQILGRQRLTDNPWKNSAEFYYRLMYGKSKEKLDPELFDQLIKEKEKTSLKKLENYEFAPNKETIVDDYDIVMKYNNYRNDYICVNTHKGDHPIPEINRLVMIAEKRSFDIQQIDYADRFSVFDTIGRAVYKGGDRISREVSSFLGEYYKVAGLGIVERLKFICDAGLKHEVYNEVALRVDEITRRYLVLGPERLKALGYNITRIKEEIGITAFNKADLELEILKAFSVGEKYLKPDLKEKLQNLYDSLNYDKLAKTTDLEEWFILKRVRVVGNKEGVELLKKYVN